MSLDSILNYIYQYAVVNEFVHLIFMFVLLITLFYILYNHKKMFNIYERTILYIFIILGTLHHILRIIPLIMKQQY